MTGALTVLAIVAFVAEGMRYTVKGYRPQWWAFGVAVYILGQMVT